ncbi:glycosidase [Specibacter cremeus]|uniref:pullulanase X25 domain-containing protein n=1 Tax=Specibacter cremeus TaxID=1629051 RepID=UPI000F77BFB3|nr:glycosidase [Specibacter cremeus]
MAAGSWADEKPGGGAVLAEAAARVPFTPEEAELLSGGIPRGHKTLTAATAQLVKAGWMLKGRGGWTITEDGLRATVAFPTVAELAAALAAGTPVPEGTPLPAKPAEAKTSAKKTPRKPAAKKPAARAKATEAPAAAAAVVRGEQPASVAIAGDFGTLLGAPADWEPAHEQVQMRLDESAQAWILTAELPSGFYKYKAVVNGSWHENYGAFGVRDGADHEFAHDGGPVTFRYDHATHDVLRA